MTLSSDLYEILQVSPNAEPEVITAAYHRLARKYHPDVSREPNAAEKMKALNEAYDTLGDADRRRAYDQWRRQTQATAAADHDADRPRSPEQEPTPERETAYDASLPPTIVCERCGRADATLRFSVFLYVVSVVIMSFRRGQAGVYCSSCRRALGLSLSGVSVLLGPWGIPWGILWTIQALWRNLRGGEQPDEHNAVLLKLLAVQFARSEAMDEAKECLWASLRLRDDDKVRAFLSELEEAFPTAAPRDYRPAAGAATKAADTSQLRPFLKAAVPLLIAAGILSALTGDWAAGPSPDPTSTPTVPAPLPLPVLSTRTSTPVGAAMRAETIEYGRQMAPLLERRARLIDRYNSLMRRASWTPDDELLSQLNDISRTQADLVVQLDYVRVPAEVTGIHAALRDALHSGVEYVNAVYEAIRAGQTTLPQEVDELRRKENAAWSEVTSRLQDVFDQYSIDLDDIGYVVVPTSTPVPSPTPIPAACVAFTDGDGVILRYAPRMDAHSTIVHRDGTRIRIVQYGTSMTEIIGPDGYRGWIPTKYWTWSCR